jgi:hypothetical protein
MQLNTGRASWLRLGMWAVLALNACSRPATESIQTKAQQLKESRPNWARVVAEIGPGSDELKRVDHFTTVAVGGQVILQEISDPKQRAAALQAWENEVNRALPTLAQKEHHAAILKMLGEVNVSPSGSTNEVAR